MSEDLERRLRSALHDAPLPGAPSTLRAALLTVPDAAAADARQTPRWQRLPLALAAGLVLAVVGLAGFGVLNNALVGPVGPSPSTLGSEPPAPPPSVQVLDATQLSAAIAAQRAGGLAPQAVVTSVGVDTNMLARLTLRECGQPIGSCAVIGVLDGMHDPDGTVTIRMPAEGSGDLPTPTTAADLVGPVVLRLAGTAPIEFLGHVNLQGAAGQVDVPALLAATATAPAGEVRAVDGWLVGNDQPSCGPYRPPLPRPFACPPDRALLTASPVRPKVAVDNGFNSSTPDGAILVQDGAYRAFAPSPANDGLNDVPRRGLYLVRMVAVDTAECPACRGWLIVGRLDAAPAPAPSASAPVAAPGVLDVLSAAQAADALAGAQSSLLGRPLLIDGKLALDASRTCAVTDAWCVLGHLDGTTVPVFATGYTNALMPPDYSYTTNSVMAFVVEATGLQYLGYMGSSDGVSFEFPIATMTDLTQQPRGPMVVAVRGWLVAGPPMPCPAPMPGTPPNTPFEGCPAAWLAQDGAAPWFWNGDQIGFRKPEVALEVQYGAYFDFAPNPATGAGGMHEPRYGTYLVRLVTDTSHRDATAARGWQVVGRLDPAPVIGPPLDAPLPSLAPTPGPSPKITCIPESNLRFGGDPCPSAIDAALATVAGRFSVTRLYLEPGMFRCRQYWAESIACFGPVAMPGTAMRGWIAFDSTGDVAAVQLGRSQPSVDTPQPPWDASIKAFEVPPAGWSMPVAPTAMLPADAPMTFAACGWPEGTPLAFAGWGELGKLGLPATFGPAASTERVYVIVSSGRISQQPMVGPAIVARGGCMRGADGRLTVSTVPDDWQPPAIATPYVLDCGPLAVTPDLCASAAATALQLLSMAPNDVTAVRIADPATATCGAAGPCRRPTVVVTATTPSGPTSDVPLVRTESGWVSLSAIR